MAGAENLKRSGTLNTKLITVAAVLGVGVIVVATWFYTHAGAVDPLTTINQESLPSVNAEINSQAISVLTRQLDWEQRRYSQLQEAYNMVSKNQNTVDSMKTQVTALAVDLNNVQLALNNTQTAAEQLRGDANAEKRQLVYDKNSSQAALEDKIIEVQSGQATANPAQAEAQKNNIVSSMKNIERETENQLLVTAQNLQNAQIQILSQKQDLERQAADIKSELDYWNGQMAGTGDEKARLSRIENLRKEMAEQERKVGRIQQQLSAY